MGAGRFRCLGSNRLPARCLLSSRYLRLNKLSPDSAPAFSYSRAPVPTAALHAGLWGHSSHESLGVKSPPKPEPRWCYSPRGLCPLGWLGQGGTISAPALGQPQNIVEQNGTNWGTPQSCHGRGGAHGPGVADPGSPYSRRARLPRVGVQPSRLVSRLTVISCR